MRTALGGSQVTERAPRSVVAVSGLLQRPELVDVLLAQATNRDIVFVESIARGYSRIKQLTPDLVVVLVGIDDAPACQLLSMLKMDCDTSGIPVVTWMTRQEETEFEEILAEINQDASSGGIAVQMN
jgi:5,10-methylene-tetrahydrofolate dehydrogenase/methenyl tetrahydrofolate cyclohydrolase